MSARRNCPIVRSKIASREQHAEEIQRRRRQAKRRAAERREARKRLLDRVLTTNHVTDSTAHPTED